MLNKSDILRLTNNGLNVFKHYIPGQWRVGRNFLNPLYEDRKASCNIYFDRRSDCYRMKDFGNDSYSGDCFDIVGKLKGLDCGNPVDFVEILKTVNRDLSLGIDENDSSFVVSIPDSKPKKQAENSPDPAPKKAKPYSVIQQSFEIKELSFWRQYGITADILKTYKVVSLREFKSENKDGKPFTFHSTDTEPIFGYQGKRHIKIYRPHSEIRFLYGGLLPENYCFGLEQLPAKGDTLFITGGEKDVMSLAAHGFHAICFNSETSNIPQGIIKKLSYRFKHIVLLYDTDKTGLESSAKHEQQLSPLGVKRLVLPLTGTKQEKDISDYFKLGKTKADFTLLFIEFLDALYSETMAILKPCEIDFSNPPIQSEMLISINDVPLGTQGNLLGITGGEGTGKSNYVGSLIAGTITQSDNTDTLGTVIQRNSTNKAVLLYDTEQSETQLYKNISGILKRGGNKTMPACFKAYCLTSMSRKERMQAIIQSKTCIVCVLHFVPNGMKLRGHLGSELQRKAAAILSIEKDENPQISVVKALKVRDGSPLDVPLVQFSWDKELEMHTFFGEKPKEEKEKRKETELAGIARTVFSRQKFYTYIELCGQIQALLDVSERTAKSYIKFMRDREIILKDPSNESYFIVGHING